MCNILCYNYLRDNHVYPTNDDQINPMPPSVNTASDTDNNISTTEPKTKVDVGIKSANVGNEIPPIIGAEGDFTRHINSV
ncbi:unnamed protein product, partial [Rotaria sp. Silwood2]